MMAEINVSRVSWLIPCLLLVLANKALFVSCEDKAPQLENYDKAHHCCNEPNILERPCRAGSLFNCTSGSYLLDPLVDPADTFSVTNDGRLLFGLSEEPHEYNKYCIARFEMEGSNQSHFVARLCFEEPVFRSEFTLKGTLSLISVIFLGITVYVYNVIVMRDTQDRVTRIAIVCLLIFFLTLGSTHLFTDLLVYSRMCTVIAFLTHFFVIAYFSWINMVMANVWKSVVVPRWAIEEYRWYRWNHIYAWSIPICIQAIMFFGHFTDHEVLDPRIGDNSCWFATDQLTLWYNYIPITVMLIINVVLFVWTCFVLSRYGSDFNPDKKNQLKYRVMMYLKFFLLVGLTWIFDVMSFFAGDHILWLIFDILNALQGFLLFLILVVFRSRIKRELAGKKICCCLHAPEHWRNNVDVEHQRLNENDDEVSEYTTNLILKG